MTKKDSVTGSRDLQRYSLIQDFWQMFALLGKVLSINDGGKIVEFQAIDIL